MRDILQPAPSDASAAVPTAAVSISEIPNCCHGCRGSKILGAGVPRLEHVLKAARPWRIPGPLLGVFRHSLHYADSWSLATWSPCQDPENLETAFRHHSKLRSFTYRSPKSVNPLKGKKPLPWRRDHRNIYIPNLHSAWMPPDHQRSPEQPSSPKDSSILCGAAGECHDTERPQTLQFHSSSSSE